MNNALVDKFEPWGFEDGIALFKDKSLGFGFKIKPHDISCESDEKVNQIKVQLRSLLGSLPSGIDVQFVQAIDKAGATDLDEHLNYSEKAIPMIRQVAEVRHQKFSELNEVGALPSQENFVLLRVPFDDQISAKVRVFDMKFARNRDETETRLHSALSRAETMRAEIERNLTAAGFSVERLTPPEIVQGIFEAWNPNHAVGLAEFDETDIRDRVLLSELVKDVRGFRLGTTHHRVVTLIPYPEAKNAAGSYFIKAIGLFLDNRKLLEFRKISEKNLKFTNENLGALVEVALGWKIDANEVSKIRRDSKKRGKLAR